MIDKQTKTNFESFSKDYPDLSQLVKDARTKTVNLIKQLDDLNSAPQPPFRPGVDSGVNSGNSKNDNIRKQILDTKADLDKQVDERTSYYPQEIKNDINNKINYLTNPENKELDQKESKESFDFMDKMHFRGKENQDNANKQYKESAIERSSDRFNALLVSYREDNNKLKEPEIDKSSQKNDIKDYPKSSNYYNQSLNYKFEPLTTQEPELPNQEELSKDEIEGKNLKKGNDNGDKQLDDLSEYKDELEKKDLNKEEAKEENDIVSIDVPEPNIEDSDPEPDKD